MGAKKFSKLHVNNLSIEDLYSISKSTTDIASEVKDNIGEIGKIAMAQLITDNTAMGEQMNKQRKSSYTEQLVEKEADRDERFSEIKRNITTALKGRNAEKSAAGETLKLFFSSYWDIEKKAMNSKTGILYEMFQKYNASETLKTQAAIIGINDMLTELETVNIEFDTLYKARNDEQATQTSPSATNLKSATIKSYEQFCIAIEQAVNFMPNDNLTLLFNKMDDLRKKYSLLVSKTEKEETTTTTETK